MNFRKIIFWLHLFCGIVTGIIVLIMSVTGVALTYQKQMTAWADKKMYPIQAPSSAAPLPVSTLIESFRRAQPNANPATVTLSSDPTMPATLTIPPNRAVFMNPYTGKMLGEGSQRIRKFFQAMTDWHRWLALTGNNRGIGKAVTGACNFIFLFLAVSGVYLWWPRKWTHGILRTIGWFRFGLTSTARDFNWHHVFGFWCLIPLILIIVSALVISYGWAGKLLFRITGSEMTYQAGPPKRLRGGTSAGDRATLQLDKIDGIAGDVQSRSDGWRSISIPLPTAKDKTISVSVETGSEGQPQHRSSLIVDTETGAVIRAEGFGNLDPGLRARLWMRFVHTGEYYGLPGQTVAGIASLAGVILVWTGSALTYRRFFAATELNNANIQSGTKAKTAAQAPG